MATKQDKINAVLNELKMATSDIQGLAVISPDGMMIADQLGGGREMRQRRWGLRWVVWPSVLQTR